MSADRAPFPGRADGERVDLIPAADVLTLGDRVVDWCDIDTVDTTSASPLRLTLGLSDGTSIEVDQLGAQGDEFGALFRELRGRARRAALTQTTGEPLRSFVARDPEGHESDVLIWSRCLLIEPRGTAPATHLPLPLLREVTRDRWRFAFSCRGIDDAEVRGLGNRTDEFEQTLARARTDLSAATRAAITAYEPGLEGFDLPDGWAVTSSEAGKYAGALASTWGSRARATEFGVLRDLVGPDGLRYGMWTEGGTLTLPFVAASLGSGDSARVAIEAIDADDRATFVFATDDLDRLLAAMILGSYRREVLSFPDAELGRWAVAVRTQPHVRWARERMVARVVHGAGWETSVRHALMPGS